VGDGKDPEHSREVAKLCFDFFKHFTTIATAATLVELALFEQLQFDTVVAIIIVICSALTVVVSIAGMLFVSIRAGVEGVFLREKDKVFTHMILPSVMFLIGINRFASGAAYSYAGWVLAIVVLGRIPAIGVPAGLYLRRLFEHR